MPTSTPVLRLAVPSPLYRSFDYLPPVGCNVENLKPGARLRLPFGRRQTVGVLLDISDTTQIQRHKLKAALELLDDEPLLPTELMALLRWVADYYHHPIGETLATALPVALRQGETATAKYRARWRITAAGQAVNTATLGRRAKRQADLLQRLAASRNGLTADQLSELPRNWTDAMAALVKKGWAAVEQIAALECGHAESDPGPALNPAQAQAVEAIERCLNRFSPVLLDGVTGSGKTEVYLHAIAAVLLAGRQALVLVPEITLTPQLVERFKRRFNVPMAVLHSGLGDRERLNAWLLARGGEAAIIIGTRSAVFTPLLNPGIIIVDEEHDSAFKQQSGLRYSARDLAIVRAQRLDIPVILGSATPSLESLLNVAQGRYRHLTLPQRAGSAQPPTIQLMDVRHQPMEDQLSAPLLRLMQQHLDRDNQVLLFLNRRGFSPTLICHECGWVAHCRRCDTHMTLHLNKRQLRCHHCGSQRPVVAQCPDCGSPDLRPLGSGTERIETALTRHFPDIGVSRIDRDSTQRKGSLEALLDEINRGGQRILIGTQMLAKGHHFPDVTLVGVLDGDQGLFGVDFRAGERMAQLIIQVAGRAGRAEKPGQVVIQTHHPDNPMLQLLCREGYHAYAEAAMDERRLTALPPYSHLALLRAEASHSLPPENFLQQAEQLAQQLGSTGVERYGPMPAVMERRAGKYRFQLLLQAERRADLHRLLTPWTAQLNALPEARKVRWSLDVDPVDLI
ncbi:primosomal protein N' [Candidatus Tenderia electrophaga]|jgi:primosomal protein N' (replication factor Y)|uniref:Replication restart protein PriA n=1 Tax=Candidatus Tenderia electrophaga TaxID=1748243 RepID=A0A0S2TGA5_9GAMM|nr:primosomal protein N' [Candidatus Tenderia electrophaga]